MIKVSHECPKSLFEKSKGFNDYEYCLAHLYASDPEYRDFYKKQSASGRECILDNSIFEGRGLSNEEFADIIMDLKPSHYIIPDVLEDTEATIANMIKFKKDFPDLPGKVICVVQGKTYEELIKCYRAADKYGDKIAISFDYSYYESIYPQYCKLDAWCRGRQSLISRLIMDGVWNGNKPHHLLGCGLAKEFNDPLYQKISIESIDTSNPVVAGIKHMMYDGIHGLAEKPSVKLCDLIDYDIPVNDLPIVDYNITAFKRIIGR